MNSSLPKTILTVVLIIAVSAVITTVSFTAFYYYVTREEASPAEEAPVVPLAVILEMDLGQFRTNLADGRFAQITIVLQYPEMKERIWFGLREGIDETLPKMLESDINQIKDAINTVLRAQTSASLNATNVERVKAEMVAQINRILNSNKYAIVSVLFTDIVVT